MLRRILLGGAILALGVSIVINVLQSRRILELQEQIEALSVRGDLQSGSEFRSLSVRDMNGKAATIDFGGSKPTIIYVFRPSCVWCRRNSESVNSLARQLAD